MFRAVARRSPLSVSSSSAIRAYTDYAKHDYPHLKPVTGGVYAACAAFWLVFFAWGSVFWEGNREWKRQVGASWARRLPKGYVWADELPQEPIKNIYKNLPVGVEE
eukprot:CAMPEP_0174828620 /NCGR_PEP_ID=MMETSP1114-20130205/1446_1 /TAXON_ID=312471 /ORGANISM="Neobodo designis, Strain CCAP 1951/1" /LENGTH=105 /DNA_ID=CAMNT_0016062343 /DNA_START=30 /DNA_END=347 /DNA_ORIENTATION=+